MRRAGDTQFAVVGRNKLPAALVFKQFSLIQIEKLDIIVKRLAGMFN